MEQKLLKYEKKHCVLCGNRCAPCGKINEPRHGDRKERKV